jgi:phage antirepressor YoqD-like protein
VDENRKGPFPIRLASVRTLAAQYDIKPRTIRSWMEQRRFTWYKPAKLVLIDVASFEAFLFRNKIEPWTRDVINTKMLAQR